MANQQKKLSNSYKQLSTNQKLQTHMLQAESPGGALHGQVEHHVRTKKHKIKN